MNYREKIRKAIECPQFGNETYGGWGILNLEQRKFIKRLLDELDRADNYLKKVYLENKQLKYNWNELKKWLEENESFDDYCNETTFTSVLEKMLELEGSNNK